MRKMRQISNWRKTESFDSLSSIVESGETDGFSIPFLNNFITAMIENDSTASIRS